MRLQLERLMELREKALNNFSENKIPMNTPMANLEEVLVPLFLAHRYQVEAAVKLIGGVDYEYSSRGDTPVATRIVDYGEQGNAIRILNKTLQPESLAIPEAVLKMIPPKPVGYRSGRENFNSRTGLTLDPLAAAESAANHILTLYLHPQRAARLVEHHARDKKNPGLHTAVNALLQNSWFTKETNNYHAAIGRVVDKLVLQHLMKLATNQSTSDEVRAISWLKINELEDYLKKQSPVTDVEKAHVVHGLAMIAQFKADPAEWKNTTPKNLPDGSPIGMDACGH